MSYEGYIQALCKNGHLWIDNDAYEELECCSECREPAVWTNGVNDTNCDSQGEIDMSAFLLEKATFATCSMGHQHQTKPDVYRIPTTEETKKARSYRPGYGGTPLVPLDP